MQVEKPATRVLRLLQRSADWVNDRHASMTVRVWSWATDDKKIYLARKPAVRSAGNLELAPPANLI